MFLKSQAFVGWENCQASLDFIQNFFFSFFFFLQEYFSETSLFFF